MSKSTYFTGQPVFAQVLKLIDRAKVEQISKDTPGSEVYVKKLDGYTHLVTMLFGVLRHYDSLRELEIGLKAEVRYTVLSSVISVNEYGLAECRDERILFEKGELKHESRRVEMWSKGAKKSVVLLTNNFELSTEDIAEIYLRRWPIETLYKQLKQNFPLHFFYGDSVNVIQIQTWVVLIANLLSPIIQRMIKRHCSFSQIVAMLRITLMYYTDFLSFMENPNKE